MKFRTVLKALKYLFWGDEKVSSKEIEQLTESDCTDAGPVSNCHMPAAGWNPTEALYTPPENIGRDTTSETEPKETAASTTEKESPSPLVASDGLVTPHNPDVSTVPDPHPSPEEMLFERLIGLLEELDSLTYRINDRESREIIQFSMNRLIECLNCGNTELISSDVTFDNRRHVPVPFKLIPNGAAITKVLRPGLIRNDQVLFKAQVEILDENQRG